MKNKKKVSQDLQWSYIFTGCTKTWYTFLKYIKRKNTFTSILRYLIKLEAVRLSLYRKYWFPACGAATYACERRRRHYNIFFMLNGVTKRCILYKIAVAVKNLRQLIRNGKSTPVVVQRQGRATVNATGCEFNSYTRKWFFLFLVVVTRQSAACSFATQHAVSPEFGGEWGSKMS